MKFCSQSTSHVGLLGELDFSDSFACFHHVGVLDAHNTATPLLEGLGVIVELLSEVDLQGLEILEVLLAALSKGDASGSLHVAELAEVSLAADEAVGDVLSSAKGGKVEDCLNRVDIVSDDNELSLAFFNKGGHVVETKLEVDWLGGLALSTCLCSSLKTSLLLFSCLWHVFGQELEELGGCTRVSAFVNLL